MPHANGASSFCLAFFNRAQTCAEDFSQETSRIERQGNHSSPELGQINADLRQRKVDQEDLYQQRRAAYEVHVCPHQAAQYARPRHGR